MIAFSICDEVLDVDDQWRCGNFSDFVSGVLACKAVQKLLLIRLRGAGDKRLKHSDADEEVLWR